MPLDQLEEVVVPVLESLLTLEMGSANAPEYVLEKHAQLIVDGFEAVIQTCLRRPEQFDKLYKFHSLNQLIEQSNNPSIIFTVLVTGKHREKGAKQILRLCLETEHLDIAPLPSLFVTKLLLQQFLQPVVEQHSA